MLESLKIKNFRVLENFEVAKLGRINLIVGKNNSGKSSVLEALRIYAGNGQETILKQISASRDETSNLKTVLTFQDFFTGRVFPGDLTAIQIWPQFLNNTEDDDKDCLFIVHGLIEVITPGLLSGIGFQFKPGQFSKTMGYE